MNSPYHRVCKMPITPFAHTAGTGRQRAGQIGAEMRQAVADLRAAAAQLNIKITIRRLKGFEVRISARREIDLMMLKMAVGW